MSDDFEVILSARDVSLSYGGVRVLSNIDLTVRCGELWAFVGPNGEGKTTLVRAILGALRPCSGALQLADRIRDDWKVGFVPQRCDVRRTLPLTVEDFVLLGLGTYRVSRLSFAMRSRTAFSAATSRPFVGSSRRRSSGLRIRPRAMSARCRCPPDMDQ